MHIVKTRTDSCHNLNKLKVDESIVKISNESCMVAKHKRWNSTH